MDLVIILGMSVVLVVLIALAAFVFAYLAWQFQERYWRRHLDEMDRRFAAGYGIKMKDD